MSLPFFLYFLPSSLCSVSHYYDAEEQLPGLTMTSSLPVYFFPRCRPMAEGQSGGGGGSLPTSIMVSLPTAPPPPPPVVVAPARPISSLSNRKPGVLPANLEEMKVRRRRLTAARTMRPEADNKLLDESLPPEP